MSRGWKTKNVRTEERKYDEMGMKRIKERKVVQKDKEKERANKMGRGDKGVKRERRKNKDRSKAEGTRVGRS